MKPAYRKTIYQTVCFHHHQRNCSRCQNLWLYPENHVHQLATWRSLRLHSGRSEQPLHVRICLTRTMVDSKIKHCEMHRFVLENISEQRKETDNENDARIDMRQIRFALFCALWQQRVFETIDGLWIEDAPQHLEMSVCYYGFHFDTLKPSKFIHWKTI